MGMESFLFYLCGAVFLGGGVAMVTSRSAVAAACWLILAFLGVAGLFAALAAPFLAVLQVLIYAGAIMVLFLFVIMMLRGPVLEGERARLKAWRPLVAMLPAATLLVTVLTWLRREDLPGFSGPPAPGYGSVAAVSRLLVGDYLLAFELISVVLLVGIVGALSLGKADRRLPWK
jgi:NADH-quinone oxidoreductase subunit J